MKAQLFQIHKLLILLLCLALIRAHDYEDQCEHGTQNNCNIANCPGYFWSTQEQECKKCPAKPNSCNQCLYGYNEESHTCKSSPDNTGNTDCTRTSSEQICEACPDLFYQQQTQQCLPCSSAADQSSCHKCFQKKSSLINSQTCQANTTNSTNSSSDNDTNQHNCEQNSTLCEGKTCEEAVYDNSTATCVKCSAASAALCEKCHSFRYDIASNTCVKCTYNITECDGCLNDAKELCRKGCPHNFYFNSTKCLPQKVVNVSLIVNPSNLIADWNSLSKSEKESRLATNLATIKQSIINLVGLKDQSYRVKINKISVGSLAVDMAIVPDTVETVQTLLQSTQQAIIANQQASGMQVVSSSLTVSQNKNQSNSGSQSSSPIGIIIGIVAGVIALSIATVILVRYLRKPKETELPDTPVSIGDTEKEVVNKDQPVQLNDCRSDEFELASTNSK